jgi:hypothetical protein
VITYVKEFRKRLQELFERNKEGFVTPDSAKQKAFISISAGKRAQTFVGLGNTIDTAFMAARDTSAKYASDNELHPKWIYIAFVTHEERISKDKFYAELKNEKRNYYRHGIALDEYYQISFLEQELNASGLIKYEYEDNPILHNHNATLFLQSQRKNKGLVFAEEKLNAVIKFETKSFFYDGDDDAYYSLYDSGWEKGFRRMEKLDETLLKRITEKSGLYLKSTVQNDGKFVYGYFPAFDREIGAYNLIRHGLSVMALMELYKITGDEDYIPAIHGTYRWFLGNLTPTDTGKLVLVDYDNDNEIRLGALGLAIVMIAMYAELFPDNADIDKAVLIGEAILGMQDDTGQFTHVLSYPDMSVKDRFRIVYYSGEACYGLMSLYRITKDERFLESVKKATDFFIINHYEKYYDHWLSYAMNELVTYEKEDKYFTFALHNATDNIDFIINRLTSWPTFMELLNAAYCLIETTEAAGKGDLLKQYPMNDFYDAVSVRLFRQLNGIMFPEVAMFFRNPEKMKYGVYIRHHAFRVRDDDVAHHIIGYCHFLTHVLPLYPNKEIQRVRRGEGRDFV